MLIFFLHDNYCEPLSLVILSARLTRGFEDPSIIHLLLEKGVDIESQCAEGRTPLIEAVRFRNVEAIRILLENGANVNLPDRS